MCVCIIIFDVTGNRSCESIKSGSRIIILIMQQASCIIEYIETDDDDRMKVEEKMKFVLINVGREFHGRFQGSSFVRLYILSIYI